MQAANTVLLGVKRFIPAAIKHPFRQLLNRWAFHDAMKRFMANPEPEDLLLRNLSRAWSNEGWSASTEYLVECIRLANATQGPILECGSGLSTVLVGAAAKLRGVDLWSLEHTPEWGARVKRVLNSYQLNNTNLCLTELRDYGEFAWYDPPMNTMPEKFSLVICDGPPAATKGGRYGLAIMQEKLPIGCTILLDDASREDELAIAKRWEQELYADLEICGAKRPFLKLTIRE